MTSTTACPRCEATIAADAPACEECGLPFSGAGSATLDTSEASEVRVDTEAAARVHDDFGVDHRSTGVTEAAIDTALFPPADDDASRADPDGETASPASSRLTGTLLRWGTTAGESSVPEPAKSTVPVVSRSVFVSTEDDDDSAEDADERLPSDDVDSDEGAGARATEAPGRHERTGSIDWVTIVFVIVALSGAGFAADALLDSRMPKGADWSAIRVRITIGLSLIMAMVLALAVRAWDH